MVRNIVVGLCVVILPLPKAEAKSPVLKRRLRSAVKNGRGSKDARVGQRSGRFTRKPVPRIRLRRIWARFKSEPSVREVQRAAVRYAGAGRKQVRFWRRRVRIAPVLPEIKVGLDRSKGVDFSLRVEPGAPSRWNRGLDAGYTWGIQLKWALDRLIFDPNELKVSREAQRLAELREEVLDQVTRVYFERRRLQILRLIQPPRSVRASVLRDLALQRLTATVDGLTGGWFTKALRRRSRRRTRTVRQARLKKGPQGG